MHAIIIWIVLEGDHVSLVAVVIFVQDLGLEQWIQAKFNTVGQLFFLTFYLGYVEHLLQVGGQHEGGSVTFEIGDCGFLVPARHRIEQIRLLSDWFLSAIL